MYGNALRKLAKRMILEEFHANGTKPGSATPGAFHSLSLPQK